MDRKQIWRNDVSKLYTTVSHPNGYQGLPWFEIIETKIYTTVNHSKGCKGPMV